MTLTLSSEEELKLELNVLEAIDGVISAKSYPVGRTDPTINNNLVAVRMDGVSKLLKVHCRPEVLPTKVDAAREAKRQLAELLGSEAIEKAEKIAEEA